MAARQLLRGATAQQCLAVGAIARQPKAPICRFMATHIRRHVDNKVPIPSKSDFKHQLSDRQKELSSFSARIFNGSPLNSPEILQTALTHSSVDKETNNSRLAVLGNTIVQNAVMEYAYVQYPHLPDRSLRVLCNTITAPATLAQVAKRIGLAHVLQSAPPLVALNEHTIRIHAEGFKAVVAAIFLDQGGKAARVFVRDMLVPVFDATNVVDSLQLTNPKQLLFSRLEKEQQPRPEYRVIQETGRATSLPTFLVAVFSGDKCLGEAASYAIRKAEAEAARAALRVHFAINVPDGYLPSDDDDYKAPTATEKIEKSAGST